MRHDRSVRLYRSSGDDSAHGSISYLEDYRLKTVHLIFNAHLDPVWLWPWSAGLDELINTCTSVCDLLDRHPELIFTRGEAWVYEQLERIDPRLFGRVCRHVRNGRWEVIGGWYVQPDCNLPGQGGFQKQIDLGRDYFKSRFDEYPKIGYNVDSFGHAASLPDLMARNGQTHYIMMRPQPHEMALPARLFRWLGAGGAEVSTFRIGPEYCTPEGITWEHVEASLVDLPPGVEHTMCFVGVGDHGGGPTEALVQWCLENAHRRPNIELRFSSPKRFFRAVARTKARWPVVEGELQHHAVGCYSVHRPVKTMLRNAEALLAQADSAVRTDVELRNATATARKQAWAWTCFSAFHDTLGGTCLPSAYEQVNWQLGGALCAADETITLRVRRIMAGLAPDAHHESSWRIFPIDHFTITSNTSHGWSGPSGSRIGFCWMNKARWFHTSACSPKRCERTWCDCFSRSQCPRVNSGFCASRAVQAKQARARCIRA